jgi:hypothetical protein
MQCLAASLHRSPLLDGVADPARVWRFLYITTSSRCEISGPGLQFWGARELARAGRRTENRKTFANRPGFIRSAIGFREPRIRARTLPASISWNKLPGKVFNPLCSARDIRATR